MKLIRSFASIGFFTIASRIAGFVRELLMSNFLGASALGDAFLVALKIPSFLRRILAEGAFNTTFVPIFGGALSTHGPGKARTFAEEILTLFTLFLTVLVIVAEFGMPYLLPIMAPGFKTNPAQLDLAVSLTRITFPFILFISLTALYSGVLNSFERFAAVASSPLAGNIMIIAVVFVFMRWTHMPGADAFAWGVFACGVTQLIWVLYPAHRLKMGLKFRRPTFLPETRQFFRLLVPVAFGTGVVQISLYIDVMIASFLPAGSISYIHYADRLNQLPLSVLGTAIGTALLPLLSKQVRSGHLAAAEDSQNLALEYSLLLTLPATIVLMMFAYPLTKIAFELGKFSPQATIETALALTALAAGLPAYILIKILTTSFFARQDTKTPIICASIGVVSNILLSLALMKYFRHVGICMATAFSSWLNVSLLAYHLKKRGLLTLNHRFLHFLPRLMGASLAMIGFLFVMRPWIQSAVHTYIWYQRFYGAALIGGCGFGSFLFFARIMGALNMTDLRLQLGKKPLDQEETKTP